MKFGTILRLADVSEADAGFAALREDGFDCCHLVFKPPVYKKEDADLISDAAKKNKIEISALFAGYRDSKTKWNLSSDFKDAGINSLAYGAQRIEYVKSAAEFCSWLGVSDMLIHAGFVANNPYSGEYLHMLSKVRELAIYMKEFSVNLLLETGGESPITLLRLIMDTNCDNVFANLDTANLIMYGFGSPVETICTLSHYIRSVHIKDGLPPTNPDRLGKETEFGEGYVDFDRVFKELLSIGYDGPIIIEHEIPDTKRRKEIRKTLEIIKPILSEK